MNNRQQMENARITKHESRLIFREKIIAIKVIEKQNKTNEKQILKYLQS